MNEPGAKESPEWERSMIERLAGSALREQQRARRWGVFFKFLTFAYITAILVLYLPDDWSDSNMTSEAHTAVIDIKGVIAADTEASADNIISGLRDAFEDENTEGVVLRINSPGGSPVQAGYIYREVLRLREKHPEIPLYAVIADVCASGGYYIASAAQEIYADKASLVGSIGVIMQTFGFPDAMEKVGVERRLYAAGDHKGFMDPFSPENPYDVAHARVMLEELHGQFIGAVREGRGDRLMDEPDLFSGLIWSGERSLELGLVDAIGSTSYVAREVIGAEKTVDFSKKENLLDRFAERLGVGAAKALSSLTAETRLGP